MATSTTQRVQQATALEPAVQFETNSGVCSYILNRPLKYNALNEEMLDILRPQILKWNESELCNIIVGRSNGPAFCAGGDVATIVQALESEETRKHAIRFFQKEFELDYILASLHTPYVAILDGITNGGGVGLSIQAPFRVATEKTMFAMPETKIGYAPDVGASHTLSRLDGQLGTYLALTGNALKGRAVFEHGLATHYIPSRRVPDLLNKLTSLETPDEPPYTMINQVLEELYFEHEGDTSSTSTSLRGQIRVALDHAFNGSTVEEIIQRLEKLSTRENDVGKWAQTALNDLKARSPTSLKVALNTIRKARGLSLKAVFEMELGMATAYCNGASKDFVTGVTDVLITKIKGARPDWVPGTLEEVGDIDSKFFDPKSEFIGGKPRLDLPDVEEGRFDPNTFALPSEDDMRKILLGDGKTSGRMAVNKDDLLKKLDMDYGQKHGLHEKATEVIERCCKVKEGSEYGELIWKRPGPP